MNSIHGGRLKNVFAPFSMQIYMNILIHLIVYLSYSVLSLVDIYNIYIYVCLLVAFMDTVVTDGLLVMPVASRL